MKKIIYLILNIVSIFILPWYIPVILSIFGIFIFENFYHILFIGFLLDVFYGGLGKLNIFFTLIFSILYISSLFIKDYIRISFYAK